MSGKRISSTLYHCCYRTLFIPIDLVDSAPINGLLPSLMVILGVVINVKVRLNTNAGIFMLLSFFNSFFWSELGSRFVVKSRYTFSIIYRLRRTCPSLNAKMLPEVPMEIFCSLFAWLPSIGSLHPSDRRICGQVGAYQGTF